MKFACTLVLVLASAAQADPIQMHDVARQAAPVIRGSWRSCASGELAVTHTRDLDGVSVKAVRRCGPTETISLAITTSAGTFVEPGPIITDDRPTQTALREVVERGDDGIFTGTLGDGTPAFMHVMPTITKHVLPPDRDNKSPRMTNFARTQHITICTAAKTVRCGELELACPNDGCELPKLEHGVLRVKEQIIEDRSYSITK